MKVNKQRGMNTLPALLTRAIIDQVQEFRTGVCRLPRSLARLRKESSYFSLVPNQGFSLELVQVPEVRLETRHHTQATVNFQSSWSRSRSSTCVRGRGRRDC